MTRPTCQLGGQPEAEGKGDSSDEDECALQAAKPSAREKLPPPAPRPDLSGLSGLPGSQPKPLTATSLPRPPSPPGLSRGSSKQWSKEDRNPPGGRGGGGGSKPQWSVEDFVDVKKRGEEERRLAVERLEAQNRLAAEMAKQQQLQEQRRLEQV